MSEEITNTGNSSKAGAAEEADAPIASSLLRKVTLLALHKRLILSITAALALAGLVISLLVPNSFTSVVKIMPPQQSQSNATALLSQLSNVAAGGLAAAASKSLLKDPNELYVGIAKSRPVADELIGRFALETLYGTRDLTEARLRLASATTITSSKDGIISIVVTDRDAALAAQLANGYVTALTELVNHLSLTEAAQRRLFYDLQVEEAKKNLDRAETAFQATQQRTGVVQLESQGKALVEVAERLQEKIAAKQMELQGLRTFATGHNIQVQVVEQELSSLSQQLRHADLNRNQGDPLDMGIRSLPDAQMQYFRSLREFKFRETLFEFLTKQLEASKLDEAHDSAIIQVIEPAIPAERKSAPKRLLIVLLCACTGFLGACCLVLVNHSIRKKRLFVSELVNFCHAMSSW